MVSYDPFATEMIEDPYPTYRRLRRESPVHYLEKYDAWALARFEDIWGASMDAEHLTSTQGTTWAYIVPKSIPALPNLNHMDPPEQRLLRAAVAPFFMPKRLRSLEAKIREYVTESIDSFIDTGSVDVMSDFGQIVAVRVGALVSGFPESDTAYMVDLVKRFFSREEGTDGMTPVGVAAFSEMLAYLEEMSKKRRSYRGPIEIPIDVFLRTEILGERLDDAQIGQHMLLLLIGSVETFPKVFGTSILRLYQHPDQRAELIADPSLIPGAFRECLRYDMPTQFLMRVVKKDFEIRGKPLREGQAVMFLYPSGNRDEREFENPDTFDIHRKSRRILSFGHGIHRCLGSHVSEMEGRILLGEVLRRMPDYEVDLPKAALGRTEFLRGYESLPIRF